MPDGQGPVTVTRKINGNEAVRIGDNLRELLDVDADDYVEISVRKIHRRGGDQ